MISKEKLAEIYQLKNVIRYNTRPKLKDESVAEHSYFVALMSLIIADENGLNDSQKLRCVIKALLHDLPEIDLNDITHDVKENLHLRPMLKEYEDSYFEQHWPQYYGLMSISEPDVINQVVDLADALSVQQYTNNELSLGNRSEQIKDINENAKARIAVQTDRLRKLLGDKHE